VRKAPYHWRGRVTLPRPFPDSRPPDFSFASAEPGCLATPVGRNRLISKLRPNRQFNCLLPVCQRSSLDKGIQKTQFARKPSKSVDENQAAHGEQQHAATDLDRVQVSAETLVETQELIDP
jgi:hypothetical protein